MNKQNDTTKQELHEKWGRFGMLIINEGDGGGFTSLPNVLDRYERALGLEPLETWFIKRLLNHYWKAGEGVYPSFRKIEREAVIGAPKLRQLRKQLEAKGFIKLTGRRETTDNRNIISLMPLFNALALCILCDPQSKIAKQQRHSNIRREMTELLGNDVDLYSWFYNKHLVGETKLPLSVETAQSVAESWGVTLDWEAISEIQGRAEQTLQKDDERYRRQMYLKAAVKTAADGWFSVRWNFQGAYKLLQWLESNNVSSDELYAITEEYAQSLMDFRKKHSFKDFEAHVRESVDALKMGGANAPVRGGANECVRTYTDELQPDELLIGGSR